MTDWAAHAIRVVRRLASRFESDDLPMTSNDTPAMVASLTLKTVRFSGLIEAEDGDGFSG